jgi:hypothetical protein
MNTDKHGWGKIFEGRARHSVRAEVCIRTSGGQPPRTAPVFLPLPALAGRESRGSVKMCDKGGRTARPTSQSIFYPCSSAYSGVAATRLYAVSIRGYFIFFVS